MLSDRDRLTAAFRAAIIDKVERLPVSVLPDKEPTYSLVDNGVMRMRAVFLEGKWRKSLHSALPFEPTHWLRLKP